MFVDRAQELNRPGLSLFYNSSISPLRTNFGGYKKGRSINKRPFFYYVDPFKHIP